ncbi:MAG: hypothetical protein CME65_05755 [Halobacteriovoraceae bacterium]|nr:hypothetical protein [Halobacteriovoraceae bacterium]|tara:strand:- start:16272 stop:17387 length:1116 start_codon:yes stop_codon:yes gene_type:complete
MKIILVSPKKHFWKSLELIINNIKNSLNDWKVVDDIQVINEDDTVLLLNDCDIWEDVIKHIPKKTKLLIPIFGNLTIEVKRWQILKDILVDRDIKFICGSKRQANQVSFLLNTSEVFECVFPLPPLEVKPIHSQKVEMIYAGRITEQKNVLELMQSFHKVCRLFDLDFMLNIAGDFHERGHHLHGFKTENYHNACKKIMEQSQFIKFHGNLSQANLHKLYHASNISVSLSTYHDEDFGLSIAQALQYGHKLVLSDWGGHGNYIEHFNSIAVPVSIRERVATPDMNSFEKMLVNLVAPTIVDLEEQILLAKSYFSFESFQENLNSLIESPWNKFMGISEFYNKYLKISENYYPFHRDQEENLYDPIYQFYLG